MKQRVRMTVAFCAVSVAALYSGGCASHQVVKQDQIVPAATSAAKAAPAKAVTTQEIKPEPKMAAPAVDQSQLAKADAAPAPSADALKGALEKVFFDFDSSTLSSQARESLAKNAELLKKNSTAKVRIEGNCDELGSDDYNLALGERRAKAAQKYLETMGVAANRLSTISYGKEKPAAQGHDEAARAKNRRDEFVVSSN